MAALDRTACAACHATATRRTLTSRGQRHRCRRRRRRSYHHHRVTATASKFAATDPLCIAQEPHAIHPRRSYDADAAAW